MLKKIACFFGFHEWTQDVYTYWNNDKTDTFDIRVSRCIHCGEPLSRR